MCGGEWLVIKTNKLFAYCQGALLSHCEGATPSASPGDVPVSIVTFLLE